MNGTIYNNEGEHLVLKETIKMNNNSVDKQ